MSDETTATTPCPICDGRGHHSINRHPCRSCDGSGVLSASVCTACGHDHAGEHLAFICIGCACGHVPIGFDDPYWLDCAECGMAYPCPTVRGENTSEGTS